MGDSKVKRNNHVWTSKKDAILVEFLVEDGTTWKGDNGFKPEFNKHLEKKMPGCTLKDSPHIESRVKHLKTHYNAICEMMGPRGGSGFGWNDKDKMIVVDKEIYKEWVKTHPKAKGLYNKPFPYFDILGPIFGNDAANGGGAEDLIASVEGMDKEAYINVDADVKGMDKETYIGEEVDPTVDNVTQTQPTTNVGQSSESNRGKKGKKRERSESSLVEMVAGSIEKFSAIYERSATTIDNLAV